MGKKGVWLALLVLPLAAAYLLWSVFVEVRQEAIQQWEAQQKTLASEVAKGVESYFQHYLSTLTYLAANSNIVEFNERGRQLMDGFHDYNRHSLRAVTRVDENGLILYTSPYNPAMIGQDVSSQEHNRIIMTTHRAVVSDVFQAVQGYAAVALAAPVMNDGVYRGSLTLLFSFEDIAANYLRDMELGRGEYAWVLTREGNLIFRTPQAMDRIFLDREKPCPYLVDLTAQMLKGEQGATGFTCPGAPGGEKEPQLAVFRPINLANTHWSLAIAAPEHEVLAVVREHLLKWSLIIAVMLAAWLALFQSITRGWTVLAETRKRVAAEEALRESEEKLRLLFEYSLDGIMLTTPDGLILAANPAACRLLGYNEEDLKALPPDAILDGEDPRKSPAHLEREREGQFLGEMTFVRKDGARVEMEVSSSLFADRQGRAMATTIMRDLSERKKAEREKAQLEAGLRRSQQMEALGALAGGIAHDFNNVLAAIVGYAELARQHLQPDQPAVGDLDQVLKASERAKDLVRRILSFSHKDGQEKKPLLLGPIIKETVQLLRASLPPGMEIKADLEHDDAGAVLADATQMHQVLMNLITNSVQAMAGGEGVLEVGLRRTLLSPEEAASREGIAPGAYTVLTVRDTGHGMDRQTMERIFEPYFTTKEQGQGTGLGLAVVHGIVKSHGGIVSVESQPGRGAAFEVWLPLREEAQAETSGLKRVRDLPRGRERILLVEDEAELALAMQRTLESLGYQVRAALESRQALEVLQADPEKFDLLLTDLVMPGMSGGRLAEQVRQIRPGLPIIVCTGYAVEEEMARLGALGVSEILLKPTSIDRLARAVRQALDGAGSTQA